MGILFARLPTVVFLCIQALIMRAWFKMHPKTKLNKKKGWKKSRKVAKNTPHAREKCHFLTESHFTLKTYDDKLAKSMCGSYNYSFFCIRNFTFDILVPFASPALLNTTHGAKTCVWLQLNRWKVTWKCISEVQVKFQTTCQQKFTFTNSLTEYLTAWNKLHSPLTAALSTNTTDTKLRNMFQVSGCGLLGGTSWLWSPVSGRR